MLVVVGDAAAGDGPGVTADVDLQAAPGGNVNKSAATDGKVAGDVEARLAGDNHLPATGNRESARHLVIPVAERVRVIGATGGTRHGRQTQTVRNTDIIEGHVDIVREVPRLNLFVVGGIAEPGRIAHAAGRTQLDV